MTKKTFPLKKVYTLLEAGPVILVTTAWKGAYNAMPMSWHTMLDFDPPLIGCVISRDSLTSRALRATKECVINIPTAEIAGQVLACGAVSGRKADKFSRFGLTPEKSLAVKAPSVRECWASLECRLADASLAGKYDLYVLKAVKAFIDPSVKHPRTFHHRGGDSFIIAGREAKLSPAKGA